MADKKPPKGSSSRTYHVLAGTGSIDTFKQAATVEASSAEQAVRLVAAEGGPGRYVAIPERSWTELTVRVETPAPRVIVEGVDDTPPQSLKVPEPDDDEPEHRTLDSEFTDREQEPSPSRAEQRRSVTT